MQYVQGPNVKQIRGRSAVAAAVAAYTLGCPANVEATGTSAIANANAARIFFMTIS